MDMGIREFQVQADQAVAPHWSHDGPEAPPCVRQPSGNAAPPQKGHGNNSASSSNPHHTATNISLNSAQAPSTPLTILIPKIREK